MTFLFRFQFPQFPSFIYDQGSPVQCHLDEASNSPSSSVSVLVSQWWWQPSRDSTEGTASSAIGCQCDLQYEGTVKSLYNTVTHTGQHRYYVLWYLRWVLIIHFVCLSKEIWRRYDQALTCRQLTHPISAIFLRWLARMNYFLQTSSG